MRKLIVMLFVCLPSLGFASGGGGPMMSANVDVTNTASLQRGAQTFVNYCLSCHSAQYMRYNRLAEDLGLTEDQVMENLNFTGHKIGEQMKIAMTGDDAQRWFGTAIPDLSVIARSRGADWLYTYLMTFYVDESRPFGVNNVRFPDVGMPHVLSELQGVTHAVFHEEVDEHGQTHSTFEEIEILSPGSQTEDEYERTVLDLVNYLVYMGEPAQVYRRSLGVKVLLFLAIFFVFAYMLKREYWRDIH
ncbi:MAG TPA: cytochrome c1 [Chromatiaceae bacterium]|jgi:ubiquinol-cytochrome c reductase cytochrome c1 subunit|nr:cytochrome c1 [Chromatiaceae bacterium]HIN82170.1 cytochrome c1 [Chromatiales bacterium]HIO15024.1 cytochrome c1 [Chromatiales bacterium]HIO54376.1 cytochrome c1 [Chromatiales bacterium]